MTEIIIYHDSPDNWPERSRKLMVCRGGVLYVVDYDQGVRVGIPVSRWKLVEIALNCTIAAIKGGWPEKGHERT
jgi:hypothetical protein